MVWYGCNSQIGITVWCSINPENACYCWTIGAIFDCLVNLGGQVWTCDSFLIIAGCLFIQPLAIKPVAKSQFIKIQCHEPFLGLNTPLLLYDGVTVRSWYFPRTIEVLGLQSYFTWLAAPWFFVVHHPIRPNHSSITMNCHRLLVNGNQLTNDNMFPSLCNAKQPYSVEPGLMSLRLYLSGVLFK